MQRRGRKKSDLFTVPYIKHSLTAVQKKDEGNNVFFYAFEQMNEVPALFLNLILAVIAWLPSGHLCFHFTTMSAFTLNTLKQKLLLCKKRLAVYFPAAFSCEILRQLGHMRVAWEGRDCNWSRLPQMKHSCLKRQWHTFSLTCSVMASLLVWFLTVSHEPICTGLTKVALSAGRQSNRSSVCGEHQRRISTGVSQCQHRFAQWFVRNM